MARDIFQLLKRPLKEQQSWVRLNHSCGSNCCAGQEDVPQVSRGKKTLNNVDLVKIAAVNGLDEKGQAISRANESTENRGKEVGENAGMGRSGAPRQTAEPIVNIQVVKRARSEHAGICEFPRVTKQ